MVRNRRRFRLQTFAETKRRARRETGDCSDCFACSFWFKPTGLSMERRTRNKRSLSLHGVVDWKVVPRNRTLKPRHIDPRVAPRRLSPDCRSLLLRVYPPSTRNRLWKYTEEFYGEKGWRVVGPRRAAPEATFSYDIFLGRFHGRAAAFFELGCSSAG